MASNKFMTLDCSWSYPCVCLTGAQFWRSSRKILVAKKSEMANLKKGKGRIKKAAKTGDILERLRRIVSDDSEEEDDFVDARPVSSSERPIKTSLSRNSPEEEVAKVLKSIFKCSICLNTVCLPAAACASCYAVIGCIPCVEQWHASSANASQCLLCRTSMNYVVIPVLREISNLIGTPVPNSGEEAGGGSDTDTIPYGDEEDLDLRPMLY